MLDAVTGDGAGVGARMLLVIDQLEELFVRIDEGTRHRFIAALVGALGAPAGRLVVVATLRADFLHLPLSLSELGELVRAGTELVTPMTRPELERAIARPAESVGVTVEPGLVVDVATDVERRPDAIPVSDPGRDPAGRGVRHWHRAGAVSVANGELAGGVRLGTRRKRHRNAGPHGIAGAQRLAPHRDCPSHLRRQGVLVRRTEGDPVHGNSPDHVRSGCGPRRVDARSDGDPQRGDRRRPARRVQSRHRRWRPMVRARRHVLVLHRPRRQRLHPAVPGGRRRTAGHLHDPVPPRRARTACRRSPAAPDASREPRGPAREWPTTTCLPASSGSSSPERSAAEDQPFAAVWS